MVEAEEEEEEFWPPAERHNIYILNKKKPKKKPRADRFQTNGYLQFFLNLFVYFYAIQDFQEFFSQTIYFQLILKKK